MKRIFSLLAAVVWLSVGVSNACVKAKNNRQALNPQTATTNSQTTLPAANTVSDLTILVMDSTQALLEGAEVRIGKKVLRSSWDGRIILKSDLRKDIKSLEISCEGYKSQPLTLPAPEVTMLIVRLKEKETKRLKNEYVAGGGRRSDHVYFAAKSMGASAMSREYIMEEAVADVMPAPLPDLAEEESAPIGTPGKPVPATNAPIGAGKLTAGEVNDFTKWYFWPKVLDGTHKQFVSNWNIVPRQRYTVQVMDTHGYPVASRAVSLLDAEGNTLFQAVTDNTGTAELWYNLITKDQTAVGTNLQVRVDDKIMAAKPWSDGPNSVVVDEECVANDQANASKLSDVDVVFVFDATGSMGDELRYLQAEMKDVIARATEATGGLSIRTGAVVYRDHTDEYVTRISRLTKDIKATQNFIDKQVANGGGDYPEAVPEALMAALNSSGWNEEARARIAFLVLDAPCHQDSATIKLLHEQVLNAAALGVRIVPVVCSGLGESGELLMRAVALATNGTSFFLTDDSGIGHTHLKPTTDSLKVEHLNDMLVRTIVEFSYMPDCSGHWHEDEIANVSEQFIPNPFNAQDIDKDETILHGPTTLYLLDISGKLVGVFNGSWEDASDSQLATLHYRLPTGIYFVKAFRDGQWFTKKILVH